MKKSCSILILVILGIGLSLQSCHNKANNNKANVKLENKADSVNYAWGVYWGDSYKSALSELPEVDYDVFLDNFKNYMFSKGKYMSLEDAEKVMSEFFPKYNDMVKDETGQTKLTPGVDYDKKDISAAMGTFSADNAQNGFADMPCGFDKDMFYYGVEASLKGKKVAMDPTVASSIIDAYSEEVRAAQMASEAELEAAAKDNNAEYLANNKTKEGMITTESGLQYRVIRQGRGDKPKANSTVKVHYTGTLTDGTKFDSSYDRGKPAEFPVNGVIPGWQEGLQLMPVGSKYEFVIPPELGYGSRDLGSIPPNSILLFEVELLGIVK